ncbi:DUF5996 family protein [Rapidithrix thailandica]|uniref:DUF5996 family protein n=1 Tax=Rapidithrix thailandica TaxID=413964 RepID=A0AAW9SET6_9BACT
MTDKTTLPELPLHEWQATKLTLHLILQIIGKIRLKMTPRKNHWWYVTEYLSPKGITTGPVYYEDGFNSFEIVLNVHKSQLEINNSQGEEKIIPLSEGISVADIYQKLMHSLDSFHCRPTIVDKPFDVGVEKRFQDLTEYNHYDITYVKRFWRILGWVDSVMKEFSGRFYGKTCPVHLYWHHMDLAVTRFSGNQCPALDPGARLSDKDAYSHEVISFGFWAGDETVQEPAFYAYTYPSPNGLDKEPLSPEGAIWVDSNDSPMAFYTYENLRKEKNPREALLSFFESSYQAGAKLANWDIEALRVKALSEL